MEEALPLTEIPRLAQAKDAEKVFAQQKQRPSSHRLILGDSRDMSQVESQSVHLAVTSPPYWVLKHYDSREGQLGIIADYDQFMDELSRVWAEVYRVLIPGGRLVCVVGDVCLSRRKYGRHAVFPLHSDITIRCRRIGFDNLAPIIWYKIANASYEANTRSTILGKPYEPNAVIKNDIEFILLLRKPGAYRTPTTEQRLASLIPRKYHEQWFRQIWDIRGESTRNHPAPYPVELALRLVRMFSFVGDTVLDPFAGTGTTTVAAIETGRNSIGCEIDPKFFEFAKNRIAKAASSLERNVEFKAVKPKGK